MSDLAQRMLSAGQGNEYYQVQQSAKTLGRMAREDPDAQIRLTASERLAEAATNSPAVCVQQATVREISDQKVLTEIALHGRGNQSSRLEVTCLSAYRRSVQKRS